MSPRTAFVFLIMGLGCGFAQQPVDPEILLTEAAAIARESRTWRVEGDTVRVEFAGQQPIREHFQIDYSQAPPIRARFEAGPGDDPQLRVCDGKSQWTYYGKSHVYVQVFLNQIGPCAYPINAFPLVANNMGSSARVGTLTLSIDGRPHTCDNIRGDYTPTPDGNSRGHLEVCIDPVSKLILRYRTEFGSQSETTTFSSVQRDTELKPEILQFHPPAGSSLAAVISWLEPSLASEDSSVLRVSNEVPAPRLISLALPESPVPIPQKPPEGAVVLSIVIDSEGIPRSPKVLRSLGGPADAKAAEALRKWRFAPTTNGGKPVAVMTAIAVYFPL